MVVNSYMMEFIYINFHMASNLKYWLYYQEELFMEIKVGITLKKK